MEIGIVGLGRMGANMAQRLKRAKHRVVAFDLSDKARQSAVAQGIEAVAVRAAGCGGSRRATA